MMTFPHLPAFRKLLLNLQREKSTNLFKIVGIASTAEFIPGGYLLALEFTLGGYLLALLPGAGEQSSFIISVCILAFNLLRFRL